MNKLTEKLNEMIIPVPVKAIEFFKIGKKTTVVLVTLENDFEVVGTSACIDPAHYNEEIGRVAAIEAANKKIWEAHAYMLHEHKFERSIKMGSLVAPHKESLKDAKPGEFVWIKGILGKVTWTKDIAEPHAGTLAFYSAEIENAEGQRFLVREHVDSREINILECAESEDGL